MLCPVEYMIDCIYLCGCVLNHNEILPASTLSECWGQTQELWSQEFREPYGGYAVMDVDIYLKCQSSYGGMDDDNPFDISIDSYDVTNTSSTGGYDADTGVDGGGGGGGDGGGDSK